MYNYSKDGITVYTWLDTRTINADGKYPVKVRVNYQRKPKNYPTGKYLTKDEWELLPTSKSRIHKEIRESIENSFSLVKDNVELLAERGDFSFDLLNTRLGKGTGDTLNTAIQAKIAELESEERIETMQFYQCTLVMLEEFAGINVTDLIKLKYSNIVDGEICFVRQKTERTTKSRKEIRVVVSPEIQAIIDRWGNEPKPDNFIFPYMKGNETAKERKAVTRNVVKRINKRMKKIGEVLGIGEITTYTARHCFATTIT